ncbi:hypothetical protein [Aestuariicoccus sp. MJ-SS9]|uniref:hypothetical protein n=1 Tax=Aestuariicoccus sp. MJ-SS9 TaxID=3079855 RepID=UPI0029124483|nr:hypothetical protein [Aestuariicoccus sp. MJ-SS9]MDU8911989.1 hypothetical protein [Aestuariicoccus sp. MJ-SS9]
MGHLDWPTTYIPLHEHVGKKAEDGSALPRMWSSGESAKPQVVEIAVLDYYLSKGWQGTHIPSGVIGIGLKAQFLAAKKLNSKDFKSLAKEHFNGISFHILDEYGHFNYKRDFGGAQRFADWISEVDTQAFLKILESIFEIEYISWRNMAARQMRTSIFGRKPSNKPLRELVKLPELSPGVFCKTMAYGSSCKEEVIDAFGLLYEALPREIWFFWQVQQSLRSGF